MFATQKQSSGLDQICIQSSIAESMNVLSGPSNESLLLSWRQSAADQRQVLMQSKFQAAKSVCEWQYVLSQCYCLSIEQGANE